jgi:hypothetical protein
MQQGAESEPVQAYLCEFLSLSESKIGTHLLASSDIMEKNRNPLACLRNAGSYSAEAYCRSLEKISGRFLQFAVPQ